jgi:hypothetical protein
MPHRGEIAAIPLQREASLVDILYAIGVSLNLDEEAA